MRQVKTKSFNKKQVKNKWPSVTGNDLMSKRCEKGQNLKLECGKYMWKKKERSMRRGYK